MTNIAVVEPVRQSSFCEETDSQSHQVALTYLRRGWIPLPIPYKSKNPNFEAWTKFTVTEDDLSKHFSERLTNIGVLLGVPSGGLIDIDLDCLEAIALAPHLLPNTGAVFGRMSKPRSHYLYQCEIETTKYKDVDGSMLVELRSTGCQTVFPHSTHISGEAITWESDGEPATVAGEELTRRVARLAVATLLSRHWPRVGSRHDAARALSGGLARAGWSEADISAFIEAVAVGAGDDEVEDRKRTVKDSVTKVLASERATGFPELARLVGTNVVVRICKWLQRHSYGCDPVAAVLEPAADV